MNYEGAVEKEIEGDEEELERRKKLWKKIADSNEKGGTESVKSTLNDEAEVITNEFETLIGKLKKLL